MFPRILGVAQIQRSLRSEARSPGIGPRPEQAFSRFALPRVNLRRNTHQASMPGKSEDVVGKAAHAAGSQISGQVPAAEKDMTANTPIKALEMPEHLHHTKQSTLSETVSMAQFR